MFGYHWFKNSTERLPWGLRNRERTDPPPAKQRPRCSEHISPEREASQPTTRLPHPPLPPRPGKRTGEAGPVPLGTKSHAACHPAKPALPVPAGEETSDSSSQKEVQRAEARPPEQFQLPNDEREINKTLNKNSSYPHVRG